MTTPPPPQIILYSKSAHVITTFKSSVQLPERIGLLPGVILESISFMSDNGKQLAFEYYPKLSLSQIINGIVKPHGEVRNKSGGVLSGQLLTMTDNSSVIVLCDDKRTAVMSDVTSVLLEDTDMAMALTQSFVAFSHTVQSPQSNRNFSYIATDLGWNAFGTIKLGAQNSMNLRLAACITNQSGMSIAGSVSLVAGDVFQPVGNNLDQNSYKPRMVSMAKRLPGTSFHGGEGADNSVEQLEDLHSFELGPRELRDQTIFELFEDRTNFEKVYVHNTYDSQRTKFGIVFTAPQFIPCCSLQVYTDAGITSHINSRFLGQASILEKQAGDKIELLLGIGTMVTAKSTIQRKPNKPAQRIVETLRIAIVNKSITDAHLIIKHGTQDREPIEIRCSNPSSAIEAGILIWHLHAIPAKTTFNFECSIVYAMTTSDNDGY